VHLTGAYQPRSATSLLTVICATPDERKTPLSAAAAPIYSSCAHRHIREDAYPKGPAMKLITAIFTITIALQLTRSLTELVLWWIERVRAVSVVSKFDCRISACVARESQRPALTNLDR
jgi:hypothetical protein